MCFSGRGGEIPSADGSWRTIDRDEARRRFRAGEAEVLLCNDAAAEGLNFQFCGALINYDMPWNPMRVEQRIGRIDRLGQEHRTIRIVNLHYADTIETDVYRVLRDRIGLFQSVVGRLQPILAQLPRTITAAVLAGSGRDSAGYANALQDIELQDPRRRNRRVRPRRRARRRPRHARSPAVPRDHGRPGPSHPSTARDAARHRSSPPGAARVWPPRTGNAGPPARHHRSRLLRSERRERGVLVPGQPLVPAAGVAATRDGATRRRHWNLARPARLQMKEMTAMSRGGILRAGHSLPLRGFFGDYGVVVEHRMRDAWRGLP